MGTNVLRISCTDEDFEDVDMFINSLEFSHIPTADYIEVKTNSLVYLYKYDKVLKKYYYVTY